MDPKTLERVDRREGSAPPEPSRPSGSFGGDAIDLWPEADPLEAAPTERPRGGRVGLLLPQRLPGKFSPETSLPALHRVPGCRTICSASTTPIAAWSS